MQEHFLNVPQLSQEIYTDRIVAVKSPARVDFGRSYKGLDTGNSVLSNLVGFLGRWFFQIQTAFRMVAWLMTSIPDIKCQKDVRRPRTCSSRLFDCDGVTDEITPVVYFGEKREPVPWRFVFCTGGFFSFARPTGDEGSKTSLLEKALIPRTSLAPTRRHPSSYMNNDPVMFGDAANNQGRFDRTERGGLSPIVDYSHKSALPAATCTKSCDGSKNRTSPSWKSRWWAFYHRPSDFFDEFIRHCKRSSSASPSQDL